MTFLSNFATEKQLKNRIPRIKPTLPYEITQERKIMKKIVRQQNQPITEKSPRDDRSRKIKIKNQKQKERSMIGKMIRTRLDTNRIESSGRWER